MKQRRTSWIGSISEAQTYHGPTVFAPKRLASQPELFAHRAALFFTPTDRIPEEYIGEGTLHVSLPIPSPDWTEFEEIRAYGIPRFWVDLLQRATGKLRWQPMHPARVTFVRHDCWSIRSDHLSSGTKAVLDALKVKTSGRPDGRLLHYFGAIVDDGPGFVELTWSQEAVSHPRDARLEVKVERANQQMQAIAAKRGSA